jgi:MFS family permease
MLTTNFILTSLSSLFWYIASRADLLYLLPFLIYQITESVAWVGIGGFLRLIPMIMGPIFGVTADRIDRKTLLIAINSANGLLMIAIGITVYLGIINMYILAALVLLTGICYPADMITRRAFISTIVSPKNITKGLSVDVISFMLGSIVGPISIGYLLAFSSISFAYIVMGVIYLVGVCTIFFVRTKTTPSRLNITNEDSTGVKSEPSNKSLKSISSDLKTVISYVRHNSPLMPALVIVIIANVTIMSYQAMISSIGTNELGMSTSTAGFLVSSVYFGGIFGGVAVFLNKNIRYHARYMLLGILLMGIGGVGLGVLSSYGAILVFLVLGGVGIGIFSGTEFAFFVVSTPSLMAGRIFGLLIFTISSWPVGIFLLGLLGSISSLQSAVSLMSLIGLVAIAIVVLFNRELLSETIVASRS